ncbi:MAG: histidine kinase dimerization/phospho-acceptor domain-containing protein [Rubrivivax sp.]
MLKSLQARLLALVLGVVGALWLAASAFSWAEGRHELDELLDGHLAQGAALLIAQQAHVDDGGDGDDDTAEDAPPLHRYAPRVAFQVWHEGVLTLRSANAPTTPLGPQADGFATVGSGHEAWRVFAARGREGDIRVYVGEHIGARASILAAVMRGTFMPLAVALPLLALLAWAAVRGGLAPLRRLATELAARAPDATGPVMLKNPPAELRAVTGALDGLFARIGRLLERERRFTADAAHELRTPIAAISAQAEVALASNDEAVRRHALQATRQGCERATRLVEQMLTLARLENAAPEPAAAVALDAVARRVVADLVPLARGRQAQVELDAPMAVTAQVNEALFGVLLRNLVDNALRHGPPGTQVVARLAPGWSLEVEDSGPGLDAAARERLGERFFRPAGSEGSGLGWSIVRRIAEVQGLKVELLPPGPLGGLRVRVAPR